MAGIKIYVIGKKCNNEIVKWTMQNEMLNALCSKGNKSPPTPLSPPVPAVSVKNAFFAGGENRSDPSPALQTGDSYRDEKQSSVNSQQ